MLGASLDVGNRGVRALGVSLAGLLARASSDVEIFFYLATSCGGVRHLVRAGDELTVTVRNCRMSPRSRLSEHIVVILCLAILYRIGIRGPAIRNAWLRTLVEADFIGEIRGGDSFSDIYGFRRFFIGSLPLLSVILLGRPYVMLPQTYGPFRWRASRMLARFMMRRASKLLTRYCNCEAIVFDLCGRTPHFCPDVAFTLEPLEPSELRAGPHAASLNGNEPLVGINVSGLLYVGGYTRRNMFGLRSEYRELVHQLIGKILDRRTRRSCSFLMSLALSTKKRPAGLLCKHMRRAIQGGSLPSRSRSQSGS